MPTIDHQLVATNGIRMHIATAGPLDGPVVVLCHGFPESWYSWRHQLVALSEAGYRVLAPDQRGYGRTDSPYDVRAYNQLNLVADLVGLLDATGTPEAVVVGHDWGAPVAWNAALLRPDRFRAVAGLSVHWGGVRARHRPTKLMRTALGDAFLYILYFQEEGVAEAEVDRDIRGTLRRMLYSLSADIPRDEFRFFDPDARCLYDCLRDPDTLPPWLSNHDLDVFTAEFERKGTFRYGLNWYRCIDLNAELLAPFAGKRIEQPALFIGAEYDVIFGQTRDAVLASREAVPNLRDPVWISGSGHWVQQEKPDDVNRALLAFLDEIG